MPLPPVLWRGYKPVKRQPGTSGEDYVTPNDVKAAAPPLLRHSLILRQESLLDGIQIEGLIASLLNQVPVPR